MRADATDVEVVEAVAGWSQVSAGGLPDRLALAMTHAIQSGLFPDGMRLPPERTLAKGLAVSRPTVSAAMELLRERDLVRSRQGSGTWVRSPQRVGSGREPIVDVVRGDGGINLAAAVPTDAAHLGDLSLEARDLLRVAPLNGYNAHGIHGFVRQAAEHHEAQGLSTSPEQVLVTEGAHHGLVVAVGFAAASGGPVAVERYGHPGMPDVARATGTQLVSVAVDDEGVDLEDLETTVRASKPAALVVQPGVNNPTGRSMSPERLDALAALVDTVELTVIENNTLADLHFEGRQPTLADRCERAEVISVETLSKTGWGGLRIGWIRASTEACLQIGLQSRRTTLGVSIPSQVLGTRLLERYPDLTEARREVLRERCEMMLEMVAERLPSWEQVQPSGGLSLWLRVPVADTDPLVARAATLGVSVLPGALASVVSGPDPHVRLCYDRSRREMRVGVDRLARAWRELDA